MTKTNITTKMQKILISPLIVLLMLSSILVASCYVSETERNKFDVSGEATKCMEIAKCSLFSCFHTGACGRCCRSHGWASGTCSGLEYSCCTPRPDPPPPSRN
ncbi:hypothetical protein BDA96_04G017200 [Sorghum bicolor]|uniref:Uncharacterized protein n=2 Tax=Sorghum bicolor TaxID=4558 RepID=A0A921R142_SORBI|nr:hypothetical protein BDA96_04G017200 [Sorghum bicolor]OQU84222.1 hypothetical protein SORBI_3004G015150 [Sorghum bicolor]